MLDIDPAIIEAANPFEMRTGLGDKPRRYQHALTSGASRHKAPTSQDIGPTLELA